MMVLSSYPSESELPYEEEVLRAPFRLQAWRLYLATLAGAPPERRWSVYERAVRALPGSYTLWRAYLAELLDAARPHPVSHPSYAALNGAFERALATTMHKMPRIWLMHLASLTDQRRITLARRAFDRALRALPVSQHARVWPLYLRLVSLPGVPVETAVRVHRRYLAFNPSHLEDYNGLLLRSSRWDEALTRLAAALKDPSFCSVKGKTRRQILLDFIGRHAADIPTSTPNVESVLRGGIRQSTVDAGLFWKSLADYHACQGLHAKARDVFEDGLNAVSTAMDFGLIFKAYARFKQSSPVAKLAAELAAKLNTSDDCEVDNGSEDGEEGGRLTKELTSGFLLSDRDDADCAPARIHRLFNRRLERGESLGFDEVRQIYKQAIESGSW